MSDRHDINPPHGLCTECVERLGDEAYRCAACANRAERCARCETRRTQARAISQEWHATGIAADARCREIEPLAVSPLAETTLGRRLWAARVRAGFRQRTDFAEAAGVSCEVLECWEHDRDEPMTSELAGLSELVGYTMDELFHGRPQPSAKAHGDYDVAVGELLITLAVSELLVTLDAGGRAYWDRISVQAKRVRELHAKSKNELSEEE